MADPATGEQFVLTLDSGAVTATVAELAASLRELVVDGVRLVQDYGAGALPSQASGITLVPWPNRVRGGRWALDGAEQQLDLTEPARGNATHGLLRNTGYRVTDRSEAAITLSAPVFPQHGYPFHLDTSVRFELGAEGLTVTHGIHNAGDAPAPVGIGVHPYLRVGDTPFEELTVTVVASTAIIADDAKIPVGEQPVEGTDLDLRAGKRLAGVTLDQGYTGIALAGGLVRHRLTAPDGSGVELWGEPDFAYTQVFTTDIYETDDGRISAVAIEPMTCAADALNSGRGLRRLDPGDQWVTSWGLTRIRP
ncbi:aldose 1-epimerase family protein [Amnibacterium sp.]|uniref:aldose 1-epimerase family protein n=1 Tax=Amnibacterium sp. TaxID=1872496 RepID=UPI00260C7030|nr:aldose 1-epimerase family protein [Amnibacterium sp.]MCU1474757.1 aldose epimerase [Amnibacterium sp.]